ncbi:hypothetical protein [Aquimarina sp. U1-2]|uniref:hypothetical protein n=1 Tax=Aquimarina sp. U1-2 TaxID=2823141 RepID=UPI001FF07224|nr:hypothetical protein [Aquimarina sp. U1-2]
MDKSHKNAKPNQSLGIRRLEKMVMETFKGQWETAIIYENQTNGKELVKFKNGRRLF